MSDILGIDKSGGVIASISAELERVAPTERQKILEELGLLPGAVSLGWAACWPRLRPSRQTSPHTVEMIFVRSGWLNIRSGWKNCIER